MQLRKSRLPAAAGLMLAAAFVCYSYADTCLKNGTHRMRYGSAVNGTVNVYQWNTPNSQPDNYTYQVSENSSTSEIADFKEGGWEEYQCEN